MFKCHVDSFSGWHSDLRDLSHDWRFAYEDTRLQLRLSHVQWFKKCMHLSSMLERSFEVLAVYFTTFILYYFTLLLHHISEGNITAYIHYSSYSNPALEHFVIGM